jgi:nicotinate-nucleotide pyrophosphorylase (carboxylating)
MSLDPTFVADVVARALAEDVGDGDVTTAATVPAGARGVATITQKAPGVVFGLDVAEAAFRQIGGDDVVVERLSPEGAWQEPGTPVLRITGPAAAILIAERTALNFLQRLSGVATLTARYVAAIEGTGARILDTRKTTPTLRALEKAAVVAGGGTSHRSGLFDMVLIKENHVAAAGGIGNAVRAARDLAGASVAIEVEAQTADEVREALDAGAPRILLDNMTPDTMRAIATEVAGRAELEASGNIDLTTVRAAADTGVDFISVGALTHSAPALDLSLILERLP